MFHQIDLTYAEECSGRLEIIQAQKRLGPRRRSSATKNVARHRQGCRRRRRS